MDIGQGTVPRYEAATYDPGTKLIEAGGRVYVWSGTSIPPTYLPSPGVISRPELIVGAYDFKSLACFDFERPYLPLIPRYDLLLRTHPAFECLAVKNNRFPVIEQSIGKWAMDPELANKWDILERWLRNMVKQLIDVGNPGADIMADFKLWPFPASYGYRKYKGGRQNVQDIAARARDSFLPLISACTFLICWCRRREALDDNFDWLSEMTTSALIRSQETKPGHHLSWIHDLIHSFAGDSNAERIGTILDATEDKTPAFYSLFRDLNMPICIHLGSLTEGTIQHIPDQSSRRITSHRVNPHVQIFREALPRARDLHAFRKVLIARPQPETSTNPVVEWSEGDPQPPLIGDALRNAIQSIPVESGSGQLRGEHWSDFMKRRKELNENLSLTESQKHRTIRLNRERQATRHAEPGKRGPRVWYWEREEHDFRVRKQLTRELAKVCWSKYSDQQAIFDSWSNSWDICSEFGSDVSDDDDDDNNEPVGSIVAEREIQSCLGQTGRTLDGDHRPVELVEDFTTSGQMQYNQITGTAVQGNGFDEGETSDGVVSAATLLCPEGEVGHEVIPPSADQVALLISRDDIPSVQLEFPETLEDIAFARFGFTNDLFELKREVVPWGDVKELLGNGRWPKNPANVRFDEPEPRDETRERMQSFFHYLRSANPSPDNNSVLDIPSLDLSTADSDIQARWDHLIAVRKLVNGEYFQIREPDTTFSLLISDPAAILQMIRQDWGSTVTDIAIELYRRGMPFCTAICGPLPAIKKSEPTVTEPRLGHRPQNYSPDINDFIAYESARNDFLRSNRGRAAVLAGGLIARIAREVIPEEAVVYGPDTTVLQTGTCLFTQDGSGYWDHVMTEEEIDLVCGVYYVQTRECFSVNILSVSSPT
ncbi:hypothetical protein AAF712_009332 [Marasmius tenuissimus]|uniref:Uncharacterized protein n=1 Tax=Marasmius tenuissimus TaxID=585030 RepID=A0ABR2ZR28_9AGAR